ncbi:hypothetical protein AcetOrient_orf02823 [Acetobacter orientalis]|uniref:Uncharacterized protein n=1 Tax=Acetobacter orientalis TaxID=146474 RepID=A0A2Z5ZIN0_9PROT|nr:hypothetical protein AcetOrient_orf02823 [Acetobacter orientalis]
MIYLFLQQDRELYKHNKVIAPAKRQRLLALNCTLKPVQ